MGAWRVLMDMESLPRRLIVLSEQCLIRLIHLDP